MRSHRPSLEHQEAVSRRLALLSAELTAVRETDGLGDGPTVAGLTGKQSVDRWAAPATHTRVRPDRWEESPPAPVPHPTARPPAEVPVPGRHARRRPVARLGVLLPDSWRGRVALGPGQLVLVLAAVVVGVAVTGWWLVRGSPTEVVAPGETDLTPAVAAPLVSVAADGAVSPGATGTPVTPVPAGTVDLVVDVSGKVRRPGIAVLSPGSRVVDALEAAGGARAGVDLSSLNLARPLVDGEQLLVGVEPAGGVAAGMLASPSAPTGVAGAPGALVSLNVADQTLLETLPDVGPVTAQAIIGWRDEHGGFTAVDELMEVDGIGEATLARLAPLVTL
ncbi:MAG: ComEA family DNA-binding protein [Nocardioides sp.]